MRRFLLAGLVLPLLAAPAFSQSTTPAPSTQPGSATPTTPRTGQTMPSATMPSATMPSATMPSAATPTPTPSAATTTPGTTTQGTAAGGLSAGANSFTESQARTRLMEKGYTAVSALKRDKDGVWRGTATKDAKSVSVGVDYKGDISGG